MPFNFYGGIAVVSALAGISTFVAVGQGLKPGSIQKPPRIAKPPAGSTPGSKGDKEVTVEGKFMGAYSWDYFRFSRPALLQDLIETINAGELPASTLDGIGDPALVQSLLKNGVEKGPTLGSSDPRAGSLSRNGLLRPSGSTPGNPGGNLNRNAIGLAPKIMVAHPNAINLGDVADKGTGYGVVRVRAPQDGVLSARMDGKPFFRIDRLAKYDGLLMDVNGRRPAAQEDKVGPFALPVKQGESVEIRVAYSPQFNIASYAAGYYESVLTVTSKASTRPGEDARTTETSVPVKARFTGLNLGVVLWVDDPSSIFIKPLPYDPRGASTHVVKVNLTNLGASAEGKLIWEELPPGVTMAPIPVRLASQQATTVEIPLQIRHEGGFFGGPEDDPWPVRIRYEGNNGARASVPLWLTQYRAMMRFEFEGTCSPLDFNATVVLYGAGRFSYRTAAHNDGLFLQKALFDGYIDGKKYFSSVLFLYHAQSKQTTGGSTRPEFAQRWPEYLKKSFKLVVHTEVN